MTKTNYNIVALFISILPPFLILLFESISIFYLCVFLMSVCYHVSSFYVVFVLSSVTISLPFFAFN